MSQLLVSALVTGTVASTAALAAMSKAEGKRAAQPTSPSHWVHGEDAGSVEEIDMPHTGTGLATHHASAVF
jgi:ATP-dependent protease ClpP protease subunit